MISDYSHRLLRENHATGIPKHCLYLDTETHQKEDSPYVKHRMQLGWTCLTQYNPARRGVGETWKYWEKTFPLNCYIQASAPARGTLYLFGHNIFFDLQASDFFYYFTKWGWEKVFYYENQLTYILVIRKEKRIIRVVSTTNFFNTSLATLGKMLDLEKIEIELDKASPEEKKLYCRRDVEIVKKGMEYYFSFILKHDLGKFSLTQPSQSFQAFRHRFMDQKIYLHDNEEIRALEREAYHGGRVECFRMGRQEGGPFLTLDINSMYSFIMKYSYMPVQLIGYKEDPPLDSVQWTLKDFSVVADIDVETDTPLYAVSQDNKLIFPVGRFSTVVCSYLLKEALARGHLLKVKRMAIYRKAILFREYVNYFYALKMHYKEEKNSIMEELVKLFLNTLYGKFGQKRMLVEEKRDMTCDGYWSLETYNHETGKITMEYKMLNVHTREIGEEDTPLSFCAIAAHITEAARLDLWRIIEAIGAWRVIYCDTDSVIIREQDLSCIEYQIDSARLGKLKIQKRFNHLDIMGAKSYITEKERKIKGVPHSAEMIEKHIYRYYSFLRQASHLDKQVTRCYLTREVFKVAEPKYDKGIVDEDGTVRPIRLSTV